MKKNSIVNELDVYEHISQLKFSQWINVRTNYFFFIIILNFLFFMNLFADFFKSTIIIISMIIIKFHFLNLFLKTTNQFTVEFLIHLLWNNFFKTDSQNHSLKNKQSMRILKIEFALFPNKYSPSNRLILVSNDS